MENIIIVGSAGITREGLDMLLERSGHVVLAICDSFSEDLLIDMDADIPPPAAVTISFSKNEFEELTDQQHHYVFPSSDNSFTVKRIRRRTLPGRACRGPPWAVGYNRR